MGFFHVRIERKSSRVDEFRFDLTKQQINNLVVEPYNLGEPIAVTGRPVVLDDIRHLQINKTSQSSHELKPKLREFQKGQSALVGNSLELLVATSGANVTNRFIPGWGTVQENLPSTESVINLFDALIDNPSLQDTCRQLFNDAHYTRAVEEAFKCLNNAVKEKSGIAGKDGSSLMTEALSANNPVLYLNSLNSQSDLDEQQGYMQIYAGAMTGVRNPRAHDHEIADSPEVAMELLILANHLMRKLDSSTTNRLGNESP